jgi:hypothetical protein
MAAKFLGQFLFEQGLINRQQLLDALEAQRASNPVLGELARQRGMLDAAQAAYINERQRAEDKRFGDIALESGLLSAAQVESLLEQQRQGRKLFGEILIEQGALDRERLEQALALHQAGRDEATSSLALGLVRHPAGDVMTSAIATCTRLFPRLLRSQSHFSQLLQDPADLEPFHASAHVRIAAQRPLLVAVACAPATAAGLAAAFLSIPADECDPDLAQDALGELVNVLMGYIAKDALPEDAEYRPEPPRFGTPLQQLLQDEPNALAVSMSSQLGDFAILVTG